MPKRNETHDLLSGGLWKKIILFTLPLMLSNMLQLLYSAADIAVVGRFAGTASMGAVGACGSLTNLITSLFIGLSVGTNVAVAQGIGARDDARVSDTVHTAVAVALLSGALLAAVGESFAPVFLRAMGTPEDILGKSTLYMRILFAGMPASMLYNFNSAVLRARGETRGPLRILLVSGLMNVALNLVFVIVFHMDVEGVALATILSQILSAVLTTVMLMRSPDATRLHIARIRIHAAPARLMMRVGIPAGLQSATFSASNVIIQSTVNTFGSATVSGATAAANIDGFLYGAMNSLHHAAVTFAGQHYGAGKCRRIGRVAWECLVTVIVIGAVIGFLETHFSAELLGLYGATGDEVAAGMERLSVLCPTYFICGILDVVTGLQRGMGSSLRPMIVSVVGICVLRVAWIWLVYPAYGTLRCIYLSYPISWLVTTAVHTCFFLLLWRKAVKREREGEALLYV